MLTFLDRITILAIHQKRNAHFTFKTCSIILHSFFLDIRPIFSMWHSSRFWIIILQQNDPYRFGHAHCAFFKWNIRILRFEHWTDDLKIREHFVEWREKQKYNDSNTHWTLLFSQSSRWLKNHIKSKLPFSKFIFFLIMIFIYTLNGIISLQNTLKMFANLNFIRMLSFLKVGI